jgi:hypothetical protein
MGFGEMRTDEQIDMATEAVIEAARDFVATFNYTRGMSDLDPHKGPGNRLADALGALDAARVERMCSGWEGPLSPEDHRAIANGLWTLYK